VDRWEAGPLPRESVGFCGADEFATQSPLTRVAGQLGECEKMARDQRRGAACPLLLVAPFSWERAEFPKYWPFIAVARRLAVNPTCRELELKTSGSSNRFRTIALLVDSRSRTVRASSPLRRECQRRRRLVFT
jgi:hypothetical protein